jgi:hypothetical protein
VKKFDTCSSCRRLLGHRLDERRVAVPEGVDGDAAEQIEIALAVDVDDIAALTVREHGLRDAEDREQRPGIPAEPLGNVAAHGTPPPWSRSYRAAPSCRFRRR